MYGSPKFQASRSESSRVRASWWAGLVRIVTGGDGLGAGAAVERRLERLGAAPADGAAELVRPGGGEGGVVLLAGEEGGDVRVGVGVAPLADHRGAARLLLPGQVLGHLTWKRKIIIVNCCIAAVAGPKR